MKCSLELKVFATDPLDAEMYAQNYALEIATMVSQDCLKGDFGDPQLEAMYADNNMSTQLKGADAVGLGAQVDGMVFAQWPNVDMDLVNGVPLRLKITMVGNKLVVERPRDSKLLDRLHQWFPNYGWIAEEN